GIVSDPQVAEPQGFGAQRDLAHHRRLDGIGGTMRQGHTECDLVFQGHACISSREKRRSRRQRRELAVAAPPYSWGKKKLQKPNATPRYIFSSRLALPLKNFAFSSSHSPRSSLHLPPPPL